MLYVVNSKILPKKQEVGDDLSVYVLNLLSKVNALPSLVAIGHWESGNIIFFSKGHVAFKSGSRSQ